MEKRYGVTAPLSVALPTDAENQASNALIEELKKQGNYESVADTQKRLEALKQLQTIADEFVRVTGKAQGLSDEVAKAGGSRVFTFGSFRLGVYGPGSDIDTLVVGPANVGRQDFFDHFPDLLVKMSPEGAITDLTAVTDSFVPIIKFEYAGISIDLIYSRIDSLHQIPPDLDLQDTNLLRGLDDTDLRSLNGTRVTDAILELVPQKATFRVALRAIKLWAQRRAIYANIMGFPGGVAWAMLTARVCQLYPKAASSVIILKFFKIMEAWNWPTPVMLRKIEQTGPLPANQVRIWNPRIYRADSFHLMPIITPAYPSMCATHNVSKSTMTVIQRELQRGGQIADHILQSKLPWKALFTKHTFFTEGYKYYLSVVAASTTSEAQKLWSGLVESKVRFLVVSLETHNSIALAHPFNKGYHRVHRCSNDAEIEAVKSGKLYYMVKEGDTEVGDNKELQLNGTSSEEQSSENPGAEQDAKDDGARMVYTTTYYIGLELVEGAKSLDLSYQVDDFKQKCVTWDKYDEDLSALSIVTTKNTDLPDDVFEAGEVKPQRAAKKKVTKKRAANDNISQSNKRQHLTPAVNS